MLRSAFFCQPQTIIQTKKQKKKISGQKTDDTPVDLPPTFASAASV
jgi:hypothetical protein